MVTLCAIMDLYIDILVHVQGKGAQMPDGFRVVDRAGSVPVYRQVVNWMTSQVITGAWPSGLKLPGEFELAKELGVSRGSLRKAIGLLTARQLLVQSQGKGTFVNPVVIEQPLASRLVGVSEELLRSGMPFSTQVLQQCVMPAPPQVAQMLDLDGQPDVFYLKRVRSVGNDPIVFNESWLPGQPFAQLMHVDFTKERLFALLERMFDLHLVWAGRTIAAVRADSETAAYLHVEVGDPILFNEQLVYDELDRKVEYSRGWFPGDRFRLKALVRRGPTDDASSMSLPVP
jgi:DNA-binding GntR family transcriptional regulator